MTCEDVEQLLPLYVGGDLEDERSPSVAAHLQACPQCAGAADDYASANQLLQRFEPPLFSDEVYAGIRRQVLNEIERKYYAPSWSSVVSNFFAPLIQPRMRWITAALLFAMAMSAFYFIANRSNEMPNRQQIVLTQEGNAEDGRAASGSENNGREASPSPSNRAPDRSLSKPAAFSGTKAANAGPVNQRSKQRDKMIVDATQRGLFTSRTSAERRLGLPQPDRAVAQPSSAPAAVRMELQTGDRNIRIIWLSNPDLQAGAKETSKGI